MPTRPSESSDPRRRRKAGLAVGLGLVVLLGGLYLAAHFTVGDSLPRHTRIAGVPVGGQTPSQARETLDRALQDRVSQPIRATVGDRTFTVRPKQAGLRVDIAASVEQATGGAGWNPVRLWQVITGGEDHAAVVQVDSAELHAAVDDIAARVDQPGSNGGVRFTDGHAVAVTPKPGRRIDQQAAAARIRESFLSGDRTTTLPTTKTEPAVTEPEVTQVMRQFAKPALSAPVVLRLDDHEVTLKPVAYIDALSVVAKDGDLVPRVDRDKLAKTIRGRTDKLGNAPQNAHWVFGDNGQPTVVRSQKGTTVDVDKAVADVRAALTKSGDGRTVTLQTKPEPADFTTAEARDLKITEPVSSFTTYYPHARYRNVNLTRAAELISGTVLRPGETFSLNETTGERTAANGFTKGTIIYNGRYKEAFGGGVSQVATTVFNAAFFAGMKDIEHHPHSFYISRYPVGREATVAWGYLDLRFKNTTPHGVMIKAWTQKSTPSSQGEMHVQMWSTEYWDIETSKSDRYDFTQPDVRYVTAENCIPHDGYAGFEIDVKRYFYRHGSDTLHHVETMHTVYTASDTIVCHAAP